MTGRNEAKRLKVLTVAMVSTQLACSLDYEEPQLSGTILCVPMKKELAEY